MRLTTNAPHSHLIAPIIAVRTDGMGQADIVTATTAAATSTHNNSNQLSTNETTTSDLSANSINSLIDLEID